MIAVEFWPDYGPGPLWLNGRAAAPEDVGIPEALATQLREWNASYDESKVPINAEGDPSWIAEGVGLLHAIREAVGPDIEVVVTEPWWDELDK